MQTLFTLLSNHSHQTSKGQSFTLSLTKKNLSEEHNYWLYFITAEHQTWRKQGFSVFVTKQSYPNEVLADHLAKTLALDSAKHLLEEAVEDGRPMYQPQFIEGWAIF